MNEKPESNIAFYRKYKNIENEENRRSKKICQKQSADENLRALRQTDGVAQTLGESLDTNKILLGTLSPQQKSDFRRVNFI